MALAVTVIARAQSDVKIGDLDPPALDGLKRVTGCAAHHLEDPCAYVLGYVVNGAESVVVLQEFQRRLASGRAQYLVVDIMKVPAEFAGSLRSNEASRRYRVGPMRGSDSAQPTEDGSAKSAWAQTDADGTYSISVPYGDYRIDGYEIDQPTADELLAGKTDSPTNSDFRRRFVVAEDQPGAGLRLDYVDPLRVLGPKGAVLLWDNVAVTWAPYPDADSYRIQVYLG